VDVTLVVYTLVVLPIIFVIKVMAEYIMLGQV